MPRFFTCITFFFAFAGLASAQSRIYGLTRATNNHSLVTYYNINTATTHTVLDLSLSQGTLNASFLAECTSDPFNRRYFFAGYSTTSPNWRIFTVNLDDMSVDVSPVISTSAVELSDIEYDPFYNRILFHNQYQLKSYDLVNSSISTICLIPPVYSLTGSNRAFNPVKQQYYYIYLTSTQNQAQGNLVDVSTGSVVNSMAETNTNAMMLFDYLSDKYYRMNLNKLQTFDPVSGQTASVATISNIDDYQSSQLAVFDPPAHKYMLPYVDYSASNYQLATVDVTAPTTPTIANYGYITLNKLFYPNPKPLIRKNSENVLMCTYGGFYQWYKSGELLEGATSQTLEVTGSGDYYSEVTFLNGESALTNTVSYVFAGIKAVAGPEQIQIAPNPMSDKASVQLTGALQATEVRLLDLSGRMIRSYATNGNKTISIERENLLPGIYMISVLNNGRTMRTQKLVVTD